MPLLRMIRLPFLSELYIFLTLSVLSLAFGVFESLLYTKFFEEEDDTVEPLTSVDDVTSAQRLLETKSMFFISVIGLFAFVYFSMKILYFMFFGDLNETEHTRLSRMLFKFVILRSIILSGALNVSTLSGVFGWLVWFSALGVTRSCALVASVRGSRFPASPRILFREWLRMSAVIVFLFLSSWFLIVGGLRYRHVLADTKPDFSSGTEAAHKRNLINSMNAPTAIGVIVARLIGYKHADLGSIDVVIYLVSEVVLLFCLVLHLFAGITVQAYDRWKLSKGQTWSEHNDFNYYVELVHVILYHFVEILHYSHLLLWSRIFSVASLIVFLHIRSAYSLLVGRIKRHLAYRRLSKFIADNYSLDHHTVYNNVDDEDIPEIKKTDDTEMCAICWEPMFTWRRLPCRHNFHESCLRNWLEQNPSCPTCRRDLGIPSTIVSSGTRNFGQDQNGFGFLLRDFMRAAQNPTTLPTQTDQRIETGQNVDFNRNMFAAAVGLNLGLSIGSAPIVTAAAQAAARETLPTTSVSNPSLRLPDGQSDRTASASSSSSVSSTPVSTVNAAQPTVPSDTEQTEDIDQVRRRTFHFDGSRYFSWLPSLHVELSEVIREVFSGALTDAQVRTTQPTVTNPMEPELSAAHPVDASFDPNAYQLIRLPSSLRAPAQEIATMFPQFTLADVVADLLVTGMPEATVENLIRRPVPTATTQSHSASPSSQANISVDDNGSTTVVHTPSTSGGSSTAAATTLVERRRELLETARRRFLSNNSQN